MEYAPKECYAKYTKSHWKIHREYNFAYEWNIIINKSDKT